MSSRKWYIIMQNIGQNICDIAVADFRSIMPCFKWYCNGYIGKNWLWNLLLFVRFFLDDWTLDPAPTKFSVFGNSFSTRHYSLPNKENQSTVKLFPWIRIKYKDGIECMNIWDKSMTKVTEWNWICSKWNTSRLGHCFRSILISWN